MLRYCVSLQKSRSGKQKCIIWQEANEDESFDASNHKAEQSIHGTVDLFTHEEYDGTIDNIQDALESVCGASWRLNSVQYEEDTNWIHYEWEWTVS